MQPAIVLLILFFHGQVHSDPPTCCYPLATSDGRICDGQLTGMINMVDYDRKMEVYKGERFDKTVIFDYGQHTEYNFTSEECNYHIYNENYTMPDILCLPGMYSFVEELFEKGQTLYVWKYTSEEENVTFTVNSITCLPVRHRTILPPFPDPTIRHDLTVEMLISEPRILYPELFEIPPNCTPI